MDKTFEEIVKRMQKGEISREEARNLLQQLKQNKTLSLSSQDNHQIYEEPTNDYTSDHIAIIGISGQFPDAKDVNTFWDNLIAEHDAIQELPQHYLDQHQYFSATRQTGKTYSKWGGILEERDRFDPLFFNIAPREAESMNPHQRLTLQESWKALEDAGYNPRSLMDTQVGLFIGAEPTGYSYETFTGYSDAIIASRLSYYLNLHGPALVVNTACSSSGVALHLACESLRSRESSLAIAGGVFANLNTKALIHLSEAGMLSPGGRCAPFDATGDGIVISEGIGIVILKRLHEAVADNDHIYGVITGSGINQDGASNGITAPNGIAQEQLITSVYKRYHIDPEQISYIEAHGTGTRLGDPIESNALIRVFNKMTSKKGYCAIGSVKSNIGHPAAAAGVIGLIKILLAMQHHTLPGLIHFQTVNPLIQFDESAFYVNTHAIEWRTKDQKPLLAALNSFGHSGTNTHLVIQEYIPSVVEPLQSRIPQFEADDAAVLVPLSARDQDRLLDYTNNLLTFLKQEVASNGEIHLSSIAYTLQTGRETMEERVIFLVKTMGDLLAELERYTREKKESHRCWRGQGKPATPISPREGVAKELNQPSGQMAIDIRRLEETAKLWAQGVAINWNNLYGKTTPQRISLPTYPFAREQYWMPESTPGSTSITANSAIHPLLHRNTSTFSAQEFSSTFSGKEFFLADHVVGGRPILPGMAYLEMVYAAVTHSTDLIQDGQIQIHLADVIWAQPIVIKDQPIDVHIKLYPDSNNEIAFEIYQEPEEKSIAPTIYSYGRVILHPQEAVPTRDLQTIQAQCGEQTLDADQCYQAFQKIGIDYGPGFQALQTISFGSGLILAELALPLSIADTLEQFALHPGLMDAAVQAALGFMVLSDKLKPTLAFSLQKLKIFAPCKSHMWALASLNDQESGSDSIHKIDIDLCDENGNICVRLEGLAIKTLPTSNLAGFASTENLDKSVGTLLLAPVWERSTIEGSDAFQTRDTHTVIIGETREDLALFQRYLPNALTLELSAEATSAQIAEQLAACGPYEHLIWIAPSAPLAHQTVSPTVELFQQSISACFRTFKALLLSGDAQRTLRWSVITRQGQPIHAQDQVQSAHASIHGLIGSLAKEYPQWQIRLLDLPLHESWPLPDLLRLPSDPLGNALVYREQQWYQQRLLPIQGTSNEASLYRHTGVYVVIGGAGGIGEVWSEYMLRTYQAHLIWIGRREKDAQIQEKLDRLAAYGAAPLYLTADAADEQALLQAYQTIKERYPVIHGVLHSAVGVLDQSLAQMDEAHFRAGLSAKVDVSVHMSRVFQQEPLDFVLFFSSIASFTKDHGKSSYSAGSVFEDAFAHHLAQTWPCAVKVINWGYWGEIGIGSAVPQPAKKRLAQTGFAALEPTLAMDALQLLLTEPINQLAVLHTTQPQIIESMKMEEQITFFPRTLPSVIHTLRPLSQHFTSAQVTSQKRGTKYIQEHTQAILLEVASQALQVQVEDIDAEAELHDHGFDPISLLKFTNILNQDYQLELTPTVLTQHGTLHSLAIYLVDTYGETLARQIQPPAIDVPVQVPLVQQIFSERSKQALIMDNIVGKLLWVQLRSMDWFTQRSGSIEDLKRRINAPNYYERWLEETLLTLGRQHYIHYDGATYTVTAPEMIDQEVVWNEWNSQKNQWLDYPDMKAQVRLIEATLRALPEILTGRTRATDILFPNSSMELVEGIYTHNQIADYFNNLLADTVVAYLQQRLTLERSTRLRILEIGAGTGGTSAIVFEKLQPYQDHIQEYCYTDLSRAFLLHAEQSYGPQNPYLTYQLFNVENPLAEQGLTMGNYDVVIATNVLHATRNIRQTIRNTKAALKSNGLLLLNEMTENTLFTHLTFGLLEGWWLYEDPSLRIPGCPALFPETWQPLLEQEGFHSVFFPAQEAHALGQQIIITESDGCVRQIQRQQTNRIHHTIRKFDQSPATQQLSQINQSEPLQTLLNPTMSEKMREKCVNNLRQLIGKTLKIPVHKIDPREPLETYGIDSILVVQLTNALRPAFSEISSTTFFEYQTVEALANYLLNTYQNTVRIWTGFDKISDARQPATEAIRSELSVSAPAQNREMLNLSRRFLRPYSSQSHKMEQSSTQEPIAIIGISGRYPQANSLAEYWENLRAGKDCITEVPSERWSLDNFYLPGRKEAMAQGKSYCKWGGFLDGITHFDPLFFNISPREAINMDPQERLFLEECWHVFEDAGYTRERLATSHQRRVGVFVGITRTGFDLFGPDLWKGGEHLYPHTSFSSAANRVSYFMNFQGPSMPIDTACSSSLTAIHEACEHIRQGTCDMAVAGGVNLYVHSSSYIGLCGLQMLSDDGTCKSFGEGANGFVPGEGVGCVLLKPLSRAERDGDHIYAVIRSTSINHGGKTNGYTVPNPVAQGELIRGALDKAGINARAISYIEAHGTGTELGDPIEIAGLTQAFQEDTEDRQFCAIGSVKSNIGHLEAAAGIAGLTKIILQMQHHQIAPSLHANTLNPHINFDKTPFKVQQELAEWNRVVIEENGEIQECPRLAGISSFGAGGANAHILVEEYVSEDQKKPYVVYTPSDPIIILLSARQEAQLREQARQLLTAIQARRFTNQDLADIAYTLQVGREAMDERLALLIDSLQELETKLIAFLEMQTHSSDLYYGQAKQTKESLTLFAGDEELQEAIHKWMQRGKYTKLVDLWVKGLHIDWARLYGENTPQRISLPTYPFARDHHWFPQISSTTQSNFSVSASTPMLHPLVQCNTSTLMEQRFSSTLTGQEFFLAHHTIQGQQILPAVTYLEMARAAIIQATEQIHDTPRWVRLLNVVWSRPVIVNDQPIQIHIRLIPEENNEIMYEIYREPVDSGSDPVVYNQGRVTLSDVTERPMLDIVSLRAQCNTTEMSASQCYEAFRDLGLEYGPGFQGLDHIYLGNGQALAKLTLPVSIADTLNNFSLHPSLLDAALQSSMAFLIASGKATLLLPFAVQEVEIFGNCTAHMWAFVKYTGKNSTGEDIQTFNIEVCNNTGRICVRLSGFSTRPFKGAPGASKSDTTIQTLLFHPAWDEYLALPESGTHPSIQHLVVLCEPEPETARILTTLLPDVQWLHLQSDRLRLDERFTSFAFQLLAHLQYLLQTAPRTPIQIQLMVWMRPEQLVSSGLLSLLRVARLEHPTLLGQMIEVEPTEPAKHLAHFLQENWQAPHEQHIRYQAGRRWIAGWNEILPLPASESPLWQEGGVYLISGGSGGLARLLIQEIARHVQHATVMLVGRSAPDAEKVLSVLQMTTQGLRIEYQQADVSESETIHQVIKHLVETDGKLNGIIHSAGIIQDTYLSKKSQEAFEMVLAPKVKGLVNLDEASQQLSLDWFILFSSGAAALGSVGQVDYASANGFLDAYARYRNQLVAEGKRQGRTLSINWPLWQEGGMHVDEAIEREWQRTLGMIAMRTESGLQALSDASASHHDQVLVVEGQPARIRQKLLSVPRQDRLSSTKTPDKLHILTENDKNSIRNNVQRELAQAVSRLLQVKFEDIEVNTELSDYGFDSIAFTQFTSILNQEFKVELSPTIFFEYPTLARFTEYMVNEHQGILSTRFAPQSVRANTPGPLEVEDVVKEPSITQDRQLKSRFLSPPASATLPSIFESVAIVGMSGSFPMARDVNEFWNNLVDGKDCIAEIPAERWDWQAYYGDPKQEPGKTNIKWGGFIDDIDRFDPLFFGISPREAEFIDPQQRLLMIHIWKAIEDAGYSAQSLSGSKTGIFVGTTVSGYSDLLALSHIALESYSATGKVPSVGPNRMSYFLNLRGPSESIETACSSSLVAIHHAITSIASGTCDAALVGGVSTMITPEQHISLNQAGMLSEDGRCKTFSNQANGYVRGEGIGILFLKKLSDAKQAGDHIYGVIRGTAVNHGGRASSLTAPNPVAQAEVLRAAYTRAGVNPRHVSYIETHGTGTALGDPIEINGLKEAFKELYQETGNSSAPDAHCGLGSVKTNIGHLELAAGIAGVIKVLLQIKHQTLVKNLHFDTMNPYIQLDNSPFYILNETQKWETLRDTQGNKLPRYAGVSAFGFGGVNAHVVIEEYVPEKQNQAHREDSLSHPAMIVLSAKNTDRLHEQVQQLLATFQENHWAEEDLIDIAYTLQVGREPMDERLALLVGSLAELKEKLALFAAGQEQISNVYSGHVARTKTMFFTLADDEDMMKTIEAWIHKGKYAQLLDLWVRGLPVDWSRLYSDSRRQRLTLPTYPFARERYWVPRPDNTDPGHNALPDKKYSQRKPVDPVIAQEHRFVIKQWEVCETSSTERILHPVAIIATPDTISLAHQLMQHLPNSYVFTLKDNEAELPADHSWSGYRSWIDLAGCGEQSINDLSGLNWLQQLIESGTREGLMLLGVTRGLESLKNSAINLTGAARAALYRMLQCEYQHVRSRHLDLDTACDEQTLAQQILNELSNHTDEAEICYRGDTRYRAVLRESPLTKFPSQSLQFSPEQVLLITGGTRGLGALCARHFVSHYGVRKLVLVGQELLPPREQWASLQHEPSRMGNKIRAILALEAQGAQIIVLATSLTDQHKFADAIQDVTSTLGPIGGVIHCAGIADLNTPAFIRKTLAGMQQVLAVKVAGLHTLYEVLHKEPLQFFLLFSSISAIIPTLAVGQSDYAMANAAMDYLATAWQRKIPILSIQWPGWKETGMGEATSSVYKESGFLSLSNMAGLALLDDLISSTPGPVILPAIVDPKRWVPQNLLKNTLMPYSRASHTELPSQYPTVSRSDEKSLLAPIQDWLVTLFARELKLAADQINTDTPFSDYGVDSILLTQIQRRINQALGVDVDPSVLFEYSTLSTFSRWLVSHHASMVTTIISQSSTDHQLPSVNSAERNEDNQEQLEALTSLTLTTSKNGQGNGKISLERQNINSGVIIKNGNGHSPSSHTSTSQHTVMHRQAESVPSKNHISNARETHPCDIAIVGLSCRFPGAPSLEAYWELLAQGQSALRQVPVERWGESTPFVAGLLENIKYFDPAFFSIAPEDARAMDPQALIVLEEALKLCYHAGYTPQEIKGQPIGVYMGARGQQQIDLSRLPQSRHPIMAMGANYLAANISQFLDLHGPGLVVDTACSSALVAMQMAIHALQQGEINAALVGGVSLLQNNIAHRLFEQRGILNQSPEFHVFDRRASGVVLSEGVGMVFLKTLKQALNDGDQIYGVIKAIAINNDGRTVGPATPNLQAQKAVMASALAQSGKKADEISYIEVNGSGSEVTDLLEIKAIEGIYRTNSDKKCGLGSMKPNIGHPLCAEGSASLIKAVLMLHHRQYVPFLSAQEPMQHYDLKNSPFWFARDLQTWPEASHVVGINSFADGGTNAHVILEEWEESVEQTHRRQPLPPPQLHTYNIYDSIDNPFMQNTHRQLDGSVEPFHMQETSSATTLHKTQKIVSPWKRKMIER